MPNPTLKPFQITAIEQLKDDCFRYWQRGTGKEIKFQSPTGSGKTVMMAQLVRDLASSPDLTHADFAFLWASIGGSKDGDLASQSKDKFNEYYGGACEVKVTSLSDITRDKVLDKNEIMFFNWSKIKTRNKQGRKLRRENEQEISWDRMLQQTHDQDRGIILIIDEAHIGSGTLLTEDEIKLINPRIIIKVTATHRDKGVDVAVEHSDVVKAGLIKESIKSQTREDLEKLVRTQKDLDKYMLERAIQRRKEVVDAYKKQGVDVNPLLMIQLPNDDKNLQEERTKKDIVLQHLKELKIDNNKVAIWLDKERSIGGVKVDDMRIITKNNNEVEVLLFKQAPATGWDCPRAQVLLMYRETKDPVFQIQVLGRILRMPQGKHYENDVLDNAYLYTTYSKTQIMKQYDNWQGANLPLLYTAYIKEDLKKKKEQLKLHTFKSQRTRYYDLGRSFYDVLIKVANRELASVTQAGLFDNDEDVNVDLITNQVIRDYDGFIKSIKEADSMGIKMSQNDIEKLYKKLCIQVLREQEGDTKFTNIARSYGVLKRALNVWFEKHVSQQDSKMKHKKNYYNVIVNDLAQNANSILRPVIHKALQEYAPKREEEEQLKDERRGELHLIYIPRDEIDYSSRYEKLEEIGRCALDPCYVQQNKNEMSFIDYLEGKKEVKWWYKNGDNGTENFSVKRANGNLFFPDWFVKTKEYVWVLDTKGGFTAQGEEVVSRAQALERWHKDISKQSPTRFKVGLIAKQSGLWKLGKVQDGKMVYSEELDL